MRFLKNQDEWDSDDAVYTANGRPRPTRSGNTKQSKLPRKPRSKRASTDTTAKRGMHQRRNKRVSW